MVLHTDLGTSLKPFQNFWVMIEITISTTTYRSHRPESQILNTQESPAWTQEAYRLPCSKSLVRGVPTLGYPLPYPDLAAGVGTLWYPSPILTWLGVRDLGAPLPPSWPGWGVGTLGYPLPLVHPDLTRRGTYLGVPPSPGCGQTNKLSLLPSPILRMRAVKRRVQSAVTSGAQNRRQGTLQYGDISFPRFSTESLYSGKICNEHKF